jgi:hypothetical protein
LAGAFFAAAGATGCAAADTVSAATTIEIRRPSHITGANLSSRGERFRGVPPG